MEDASSIVHLSLYVSRGEDNSREYAGSRISQAYKEMCKMQKSLHFYEKRRQKVPSQTLRYKNCRMMTSIAQGCNNYFYQNGSKFLHCKMNENSSNNADHNLIWIDMEMTGLDPITDHILEVACLLTDSNLNIIAEHPSVVIHQPDHILKSMNEWCTEMHTMTGLVHASQRSQISLQEAEQDIFNFIKKYTHPGKCPLSGNSVYMDRMFLKQHMPLVDNYLHYRIVDVSTVKELCRRWHPDKFQEAPVKKYVHRAFIDIKESIEELRYYRRVFFQPNRKL